MAKSTQQKAGIAELIRRSEQSRLRLSDAHSALKDRLNMPARLKESLKVAPKKWVGGSLFAGLLLGRLFGAKKERPEGVQKIRKQRNLLLGALTLIATLAKPAAKIYATNLLREYFQGRFTKGASQHRGDIPRY